MPGDIILTFDFFLRDWNDPRPENAELWVCVQPHAIEGAAVEEWIRGSAAGRSFPYRMASPDTQALDLVPVDFCDDVNVSLDVSRGAATTRITNDRRAGVRVRDASAAEAIALANREPDDERTQDGGGIVAIPPGPFAAGYNRTLRDALAAQPAIPERDRIDAGGFAQLLKVAFWGGTRRYVPATAIDRGNVSLMALPESDAALLVTNLHSLCGLLFRIGTRADLASLQQITDLRVVLDDAAGSLSVLDHDANATASIRAFFSKLPGTIHLAQEPSATWDAAASARVHAMENFAALSHQPKLRPEAWYRRQSESPTTAQHRLLSRVRRLVVRFREQPHDPQEAFEETPPWPRLHWQAWDAFEVKVVPYRRFASSRATAGPLHVQPAPADRERFYQELGAHPDLFTRGDARLLDADGIDRAAEVRFIGAFDFPWDRAAGELQPAGCPPSSEATVVLHGPSNLPETLTLLVPRRDDTGAPIVFETVRTGDDDTFGPRWEQAIAVDLPPRHFTHLACTDLPEAGKATRLEPAIAFDRDFRFEFAQSASSIEGTVTATFPHGVPVTLTDPNAVDPVDEYAHDLVNHNAVNAYAFWNGNEPLEVEHGPQPGRKPGHLNPYGQIYPLTSRRPSGDVVYRTPFRHRVEVTTPPPDATDVRTFFRDRYSRIGAMRTLAFDFEHTYGTQLEIPIDGNGPAVRGLSSHYDFDLLTPPEVTRTGEAGAGCPPTAATDFMTVEYVPAQDGREVLRFTLNTQWLNAEYAVCGNRGMRAMHIAAWRAVAELAFASEVRVTGLFRRFDFHAALRACDTDGIAAGLTPVDVFENRVWIVAPEQLSARCREFLDAGVFPEAHTFEVVLTSANEQPKVFESCNVIEIFLTTKRDAARLAPSKAWQLVAPVPQKVRLQPGEEPSEGFAELAAEDAEDAREVFGGYLASIAAKRTVVRPDFRGNAQQEGDAARFRRLVGNGLGAGNDAVSRRQADPGAWILPQGIAVAGTGEVVPSVCPLTFRAPALDPLLGPMTFDLLRKYFRLLQVVIDCDFKDAAALTEPQWRAHFALLDVTARALRQADSLFDAVLDSVIAVPNVDPSAPIDAEVRALAIELRNPASQAAVALRRWIEHQLWREPALFGNAKALLFHRLRPASGSNAPGDFFALESTRNISEQNAAEAAHATYRQSLADLHATPWFGIGEVLDDIRYDSDFTFEQYRLRSFEGVVTDAEGSGRLEVPIAGRLLHVPSGAQDLDDENDARVVQLASRAPVIPPAHVFSGQIAAIQQGSALAALRGRRLSLAQLKQGRLADAAGSEAAVRLAGATPDLPAQPRLDEYLLTALYAIHGDEETATNWRSAFDNDEIRIHVRVREDGGSVRPLAEAASPELAELFSRLSDASHMHQATVAPSLAVSAEAMAYVTRILRTTPQAAPDEPAPALQIRHREGSGGDCVDLTLQFGATEPLAGRTQAILLAAAPENVAPCDESVPRTTFILMLNVVLPVWRPAAVGVVHARNASKMFAPDIAHITGVVLPDRFHQPFVVANGPALTLPRRPHTVREIVTALGLADLDESQRHDISVTVSHRQRRLFPAVAAPGQPATVEQESSFPLSNTAQAKTQTATVEFDPDYDDFLVDVQWSSDSNLQFFRVDKCRVQLR